MHTLDKWQNKLLMVKEIKIISDPQLVQAINSKPNSKSYASIPKCATTEMIAAKVQPGK